MWQVRCIATYRPSCRLGAPQNSAILNRSTRQHDTTKFVVTEFSMHRRKSKIEKIGHCDIDYDAF